MRHGKSLDENLLKTRENMETMGERNQSRLRAKHVRPYETQGETNEGISA